jgi:hypothetical protein
MNITLAERDKLIVSYNDELENLKQFIQSHYLTLKDNKNPYLKQTKLDYETYLNSIRTESDQCIHHLQTILEYINEHFQNIDNETTLADLQFNFKKIYDEILKKQKITQQIDTVIN